MAETSKERRNRLRREARAAAAKASGVPNGDAPAEEGAPIETVDALVTAVYQADFGAIVTAPAGGAELQVARINQSDGWSRLLTSDGLTAYRNRLCPHKVAAEDPAIWASFEVVGGAYNGTQGFVHAAKGCRRVTQLG